MDKGMTKPEQQSQVYIGVEPPRVADSEHRMACGRLNLKDNPNIIEREMMHISTSDAPMSPEDGVKGYRTVRNNMRPGRVPSKSD